MLRCLACLLFARRRYNYTFGLCHEPDLSGRATKFGIKDLGAPLILLSFVCVLSLAVTRCGRKTHSMMADLKAKIFKDHPDGPSLCETEKKEAPDITTDQKLAHLLKLASEQDFLLKRLVEKSGVLAQAAAGRMQHVDLTEQKSISIIGKMQKRPMMDVVTVRVVRGSNLRAADRGGKSDPYVVVQVAGGKKAKTSAKKGTINPEWDETLELSVPDAAELLSLSVWDHDMVDMNDSLGVGQIVLAQCEPRTPTALTIALSTQGIIEVVVTFPAEPTKSTPCSRRRRTSSSSSSSNLSDSSKTGA